MKIKNILIIVGSTGDANIAYNYSIKLREKYKIFFLTANIATYNFLLDKKIKNLYYIDIFEEYNDKNINKKILKYEKKYLLNNNITLDQLKFSDRDFYSMNNERFLFCSLNILEKIKNIINSNDIHLSISQISSAFIVRIFNFIMKTKNKIHIYIDSYPLEKNKFIISDIDESWNSSKINKNWDSILEFNKDEIDNYIEKFILKNNMIYKPIVPKLFSKNNFISFYKLIKEIEFKGHSSIFNRVKFQLNLIYQSKKTLFLYKYYKIDKNEKYIFFPIHVSDDAQILVRNQHYFDQINLIEIIARSLPLDYKLYIKEHPANIGGIGLKGLKKIGKNHKIKILGPIENSQEIIKNSKGVIVINGSAGLETLAWKKPLIVLGNTFYSKGKNVFICKDLNKIVNAIKWIDNYNFDEGDFYRLFNSILLSLYNGNCFNYNNIGKNTENIAKGINSYINFITKK